MTIYGGVEVQAWQLTNLGAQRVQNPKTIRGMNPADVQVLREIAECGGIAEVDEITVGGGISPSTVGYSLRKLVDLGYVTPMTPQPITGQG